MVGKIVHWWLAASWLLWGTCRVTVSQGSVASQEEPMGSQTVPPHPWWGPMMCGDLGLSQLSTRSGALGLCAE
jgi:hypothetical protein